MQHSGWSNKLHRFETRKTPESVQNISRQILGLWRVPPITSGRGAVQQTAVYSRQYCPLYRENIVSAFADVLITLALYIVFVYIASESLRQCWNLLIPLTCGFNTRLTTIFVLIKILRSILQCTCWFFVPKHGTSSYIVGLHGIRSVTPSLLCMVLKGCFL